MIFRHITKVTWQSDGREMYTEVSREFPQLPSIQEKRMAAEDDARTHELIARREARFADPSPVKLEYFWTKSNGDVVLHATPMYIVGAFGKRLTRQ